jgi:hypothetical protein
MNNNAGTKKGSAAATANTDNNATTTKKSSGSNKKASKKSSAKTKVPTDAAEAKKWALRLFPTPAAAADANDGDDTQMSSTSTTASSSLPPPGYTCVYLPCGHKTKHAELRTRLQILKINLKRVYAIQRPAKHVVSLLVHSHYAPEILKICEEDGLNPITDFDPISGKNLGDDPNLTKTLNAQQLDDKARAIYYNRMLQAAAQLSESRVGLSILKFFNALDSSDHHYVPSVIIDEFIKLKPDCVRKISAANTARSVLKGFDASALFASLAATSSSVNAESSISNNGSTPTLSTAASNAGTSSMDTNQ